MNPPTPPVRWRRHAARTLATTRVFEVLSVPFQHPARPAPKDFVVLHAPDWVNVVALTPADELVLVRQFRFGADDFSLEVPGGVIEPGEDPVAAAVRELREETGYTGAAARLLGSVRPNPAIQDNRCHLVLVEGAARRAELAWDADEELEILPLPVDEVYARAHRGEITHALVLNALLLFAPVWAERRRG